MTQQATPEFVLVIPRTELEAQGIDFSGIQKIDLEKFNPENFGFLPRALIDNKSDTSIEIGKLLPQVLPYFIIKDKDGRVLSYNRQGKEAGLLGKNSIGVGGHIDLTDSLIQQNEVNILNGWGLYLTNICAVMFEGLTRELKEEIGLHVCKMPEFDFIIAIDTDKTSNVHVGFVATIHVESFDELTPNPEEFLEVKHLTFEELLERSKEVEYEPWSQLIIDYYNS